MVAWKFSHLAGIVDKLLNIKLVDIKVKQYRENGVKWLYVYTCGPCADFQLGLWISADSVGNINRAKDHKEIF